MIGVNDVPPMPPRLDTVKLAPCISGRRQLAGTRLLGQRREITRQLVDILASASRITGTTRPFGVSAANPRWMYFFKTRFWPEASSELLTIGNSCSALTHARRMNASGVSLMPAFARLALELVAHLLEVGDVGFVHLPDMRNIEPARLQARTGNLLDAAERLDLDGAELREVDFRDFRQRAASRCRAAPCQAPA